MALGCSIGMICMIQTQIAIIAPPFDLSFCMGQKLLINVHPKCVIRIVIVNSRMFGSTPSVDIIGSSKFKHCAITIVVGYVNSISCGHFMRRFAPLNWNQIKARKV